MIYFSIKRFLPLIALFAAALANGQAFSPTTYSPKVRIVEVEPDKCPLQFYVSNQGNDAWKGTKANVKSPDGPFGTVQKAKETIRKLIADKKVPKGGICVNIMDGVYPLEKSMFFGTEDAAPEHSPIVYRAWKDGLARLIGGKKLSPKDFKIITDPEVQNRIDAIAKGKILELDTKALGFSHVSNFPDVFSDGGGIFELFIDNKRMPLSRWPDTGNTTMQEVVKVGDKKEPGSFNYRDNRPDKWDVSKNVWLKGFWRVGWEEPAIKVAHIDKIKKQIDFQTGLPAGIGSKYHRPKGSGKEQWYAINLLEEITMPGEWCIDFNSGKVYLWPPYDLENANILASQMDEPILNGKELTNTAFIGLTFEGSLGDGVRLEKSERVLIAGCVFRNLGGNGVVLDGYGNGVQSCDMYGLGKGCVVISGGDREKLLESGNYICNNHFHDYGVLRSQYSAAVDNYSESKGAPSVGTLISHNLVHHAPRDGFLFGGQKNVYEYNEVHRCAYATADVGAFYSWMDWTIRGIVIRYNYIHNTVGGVNPDDGSSGTFVYGNVFAGNRTGIWIASGPDHKVWNNVFVKNDGPVYGIDDRGKGRGYATNKNLLGKLAAIKPTSPPWSVEFPEMPTLLDSHPELPIRSEFTGNVAWIQKGQPVQLKINKELANDTNLIKIGNNFTTEKDPGFVDAANGNFSLKKESQVFEKIKGFQNIPMEKMGLYIDKYRKRLPTPEEAGRLPSQNPWKNGDTDLNFGT